MAKEILLPAKKPYLIETCFICHKKVEEGEEHYLVKGDFFAYKWKVHAECMDPLRQIIRANVFDAIASVFSELKNWDQSSEEIWKDVEYKEGASQ